MIQRTHLVPLDSMAFTLAQHPVKDRATPEAAALLLLRSHYWPQDIELGLAYAMARADAVAQAAASDRAWARWVGYARDLAAIAVLYVIGAYGWAVLA